MKNKVYKVCSLFSGCGGFDLGFSGGFEFNKQLLEKLPFEIVFSNDIDRDAINIYKENNKFFSHCNIAHDDIRNIDPHTIDNFEVLLAGFPCQPFSNAGNRKGIYDKRGTLFEEVFRFISAKLPEIIVLENVKGILSSKMPDGTKVCDEIVKRLSKVELDQGKFIYYNVSEPMLVNSSHLGVPQNRERVIIIAIKKEYNVIPAKSNLLNHSINFTKNELLVRNVLNYQSDLPNTNDIWDLAPQQRLLVPYIKRSWKDIPYEILPERLKKIRDNMKKYHSPNFFRRFNLDEVNGTITASSQPENCGILHPLENRRYSVREIARIQSFPNNFTFNNSSITQKYKVIGNAVPPIMAYAIASYCLSLLNKEEKDKTILNKSSEQLSLFDYSNELQTA